MFPRRRIVSLTIALCLARWAIAALAGADSSWQPATFGRTRPLSPRGGTTGFVRVPNEALGVAWTNRCSPNRFALRQNLLNGSGLALGDYDGDGLCDVYFCNREGANALYRNLGNWQFTNVTDAAGVAATHLISSGALFADFDGDGRLDLHVTSFQGPDALYLNRGDGTFTNVIATAGVATAGGATSSTAADLDGDGDLDLYVCRFAVEALLRDGSLVTTRMVNGKPVVTGRAGKRLRIQNGKLYESGEPDGLFFNQGDGRFVAANWTERFSDETGKPLAEAPTDLGFAAQLRDLNSDGFPDLYVCNDFQTPDRIWINDGRGHFRALPTAAIRNMSHASMGVDFADLDRDGRLDYYTVEMLPREHPRHLSHLVRGMDAELRHPREVLERDAFPRSVLGHQRSDGTYAEIAWYSHTATSDWSWNPLFVDVDLDGFEDLLISGGYGQDVNHLDLAGGGGRGDSRSVEAAPEKRSTLFPPLDLQVLALRNRGDLTFEEVSVAWGFQERFVLPAMALADLDNDGDLDAVGNVFNGSPVFYRNDSTAPRIAVRLVGAAPNTGGVGARVRLLGGPVKVQEQEMLAGGRYLATDQGQRTFAAVGPGPFKVEVRWRSGRLTTAEVTPNQLVELHETSASALPVPASPPSPPPAEPWFVEVALPKEFAHTDPPSEEMLRQPLLPWRQGFQGPGLSWWDSDGDGQEELWLGNGRGGVVRGVGFTRTPLHPPVATLRPALSPPLADDAQGLLGLNLGEGRRSLWVAISTFERGQTSGPTALRFTADTNSPSVQAGTPLVHGPPNPGPLAAGDLDGDGDLDLFVGGRPGAGRYPEAADAVIFRNDDGEFHADPAASQPFRGLGIATAALITDLDQDGRPEIVVACEWGALRVFSRTDSTWVERTAALGLDRFRGLWQTLEAGDFDGDGRLDLVAGNWGLNSYHQRTPKGPWSLAFGDFDGDGRISIIESYFEPTLGLVAPMRHREILAPELPWLIATFPKHADYARASLDQVLGEHASQASRVEATTLASMVLLNRGDHFESVPLPREAQWTPISSFAVADFDGDGDLDLVAAQNFFDVRDEDDRFDAGRGLLLLNDGAARWRVVPAEESGILELGEQRGTATADVDGDGRVDLALAVNGGPARLWQNHHATPGIRLRFDAGPMNPEGIGTQFRVLDVQGAGPLQEVRAGGGRFSQSSARPVVGHRGAARELWVRFPGQAPRTFPLPASLAEAVVSVARGLEPRR